MVFNAHSVLRDFRSYEDLNNTPLRDIIEEIEYFTPKLNEIARRQEAERLKAELAGKQHMVKPGRKGAH